MGTFPESGLLFGHVGIMKKKTLIVALALLGGLAGLVLLLWLARGWLAAAGGLCPDLAACKNLIVDWVTAAGPWGPVVFILIQALQVVLAPIPGEVTGFLGGFLFGAVPGFLYSSVGLTLGSILIFLVGRCLEKSLLERLVPPAKLQQFDLVMERQGALIAFVLFLIPGAPKDYLSLVLGLSPMPLAVFVPLVACGRMPATFALSLQGARVYRQDYLSFLLLLGLCLILALLLVLYRQRLYRWLHTLRRPPRQSGE